MLENKWRRSSSVFVLFDVLPLQQHVIDRANPVRQWILLFGLTQQQPLVLSFIRALQWETLSVSEAALLQRHVLHCASGPFPLCPQERRQAVFLVFIEQEVEWTGRLGSVFRHRCSRARLGPGAHCSLSGNDRGLFLLLLLNSVRHCVSPQQRKVCVCVWVCSCLLIPTCSWCIAAQSHREKEIADPLFPQILFASFDPTVIKIDFFLEAGVASSPTEEEQCLIWRLMCWRVNGSNFPTWWYSHRELAWRGTANVCHLLKMDQFASNECQLHT